MEKIKNEMIDICNDIHWEIERLESELREKIKNLEEKNIDMDQYYADNRKVWFKKIVYYMANGLSYKQAVQLLASEFNCDWWKINRVLDAGGYERRAIDLYAKVYTARTLKKAGFTIKKIAEVMNLSTATVARFLKCLKLNLSINDTSALFDKYFK